MRNAGRFTGFGRIALSSLALGIGVPNAHAESWKVEATYELPNLGLSEFLTDELPGLGTVGDHGIDLGGIGSDLWADAGGRDEDDDDGDDGERGRRVYWMITDRGPNGEDPRTFPVSEFTPFILKVETRRGAIDILDSIPVTGLGSTEDGVTGLANLDNTTEPPALNEPFFDCAGLAGSRLEPNPHGLDTEPCGTT